MGTHFVKEGNAFYEIDDDCLKRKKREETEQKDLKKSQELNRQNNMENGWKLNGQQPKERNRKGNQQ